MSHSVEDAATAGGTQDLICRGCLKEGVEMTNMFQVGLDVDFFRYTEIPVSICNLK